MQHHRPVGVSQHITNAAITTFFVCLSAFWIIIFLLAKAFVKWYDFVACLEALTTPSVQHPRPTSTFRLRQSPHPSKISRRAPIFRTNTHPEITSILNAQKNHHKAATASSALRHQRPLPPWPPAPIRIAQPLPSMTKPASDSYDALARLLTEMSQEPRCLGRVEKLFAALLKEELKQSHNCQSLEVAYISTFQSWVKDLPRQPEAHDKHWQLQSYVAARIVDAVRSTDPATEYDCTRETFITSLSQKFEIAELFPTATAAYLKHCKWMYTGRQTEEKTPEKRESHAGETCKQDRLRYLPESLTLPSTCANCTKSSPPLVCKQCVYRAGREHRLTVGTAYCSVECQQAHWPLHRQACSDQMTLVRIVAFAGALLPYLEGFASTVSLNSVSKNALGLDVIDLRFSPEEVLTGKPLLRTLPARDFFREENQHLMELIFYSSLGPYVPMLLPDIFEWLMQDRADIITKVEQVSIQPKNVAIPVLIMGPDFITAASATASNKHQLVISTMTRHHVLRITLRNGDVFIIDLFAERFGWYEIFCKWEDFAAHRVWQSPEIIKIWTKGADGKLSHLSDPQAAHEEKETKQIGGQTITSFHARVCTIIPKGTRTIGPLPSDPALQKSYTHSRMLRMASMHAESPALKHCRYNWLSFRNVEKYKKCKEEVVDACGAVFRACMAARFTGTSRLFMDGEGRVRITQLPDKHLCSEKDVLHLERVWMRPSTGDKVQGSGGVIPKDPEEALKLWRARLQKEGLKFMNSTPGQPTIYCTKDGCELCKDMMARVKQNMKAREVTAEKK